MTKNYEEKLTKTELANKLGISRPTLDTYLKNGFPNKITDTFQKDDEYRKILIENDIKILEYQLSKLKAELKELEGKNNE